MDTVTRDSGSRVGPYVLSQQVRLSWQPSPPSLAKGHSVPIRVERRDPHPERVIPRGTLQELNALRLQRLEIRPQVIRLNAQLPPSNELDPIFAALFVCSWRQDHLKVLPFEGDGQESTVLDTRLSDRIGPAASLSFPV